MSTGSPDWPAMAAGNLARFWTHAPRTMGQRMAEWDDAWAGDGGSPAPFPNSATLVRPLGEAATSELVARLTAFYDAGEGGSWMLWSTWPTPDLTAHGLRLLGHPPLMVRPAAAAPLPQGPSALRIVEVADAAGLRDFEETFVAGYPSPELASLPWPRLYDERALGGPLHLFVGYAGDEPVTVAASYVDGKAVGVYGVATLSSARGKGYGAAITGRAAQAGVGLPAVLQSSEVGLPVYLRLGFRVVANCALWLRPRRPGS